jgi:peptidoglycan-N-acetylglucosamine deacetylase
MKVHGDAGWEQYPSYFNIFVPHVLDLLNRLNLRITFFIVGQDAAMDQNREYLQEIVSHGHEVGNHSFYHESWLQKYSAEAIKKEINAAHQQIVQTTGQEPVGFRGPGFSWSATLLETLADRNYLYDASTLPTYIGPLARRYYFSKSTLDDEEKKERSELFGSLKDGFRPVKPYLWRLGSSRTILELPVTTMPIVKTPFHLSYLLYLSRISYFLMLFYLNLAITMCRMTGTTPSYLLHPLDLIGGDKLTALDFFPGMDLASERKVTIFCKVLSILSKHFQLANMSTHARHLLGSGKLKHIAVS